MRQFNQDELFDKRQERGQLTPDLLTSVARQAALFPDSLAPIAGDKPPGTPEAVYAAMPENFDQIRPLLTDQAPLTQPDALDDWAPTTFQPPRQLVAPRS